METYSYNKLAGMRAGSPFEARLLHTARVWAQRAHDGKAKLRKANARASALRRHADGRTERLIVEMTRNREAMRQLRETERERDEAQRVKYGTPCKCESWVAACRAAEDERDEARAEVERLRLLVGAMYSATERNPLSAKQDAAVREIVAALKGADDE